MSSNHLKTAVIVTAIVAGGFSVFYAFRARPPVCAENGKYMSTKAECQAWGLPADACAQAIDKARAVAAKAAPKTETMFQCELRFSDCFANPDGGFTPTPSFCLRPGAEPSEIRYLEYESDRRNRKTTKEVRIN